MLEDLADTAMVKSKTQPKIVYSRTLDYVGWKNSILKKEVIKEEVLELKEQTDKNIVVGSPSLIVTFTSLDLIDEYQLCVQPTVLGSGLPLFKDIRERVNLNLLKTKTFGCGAVAFYYERKKNMSAWWKGRALWPEQNCFDKKSHRHENEVALHEKILDLFFAL